tara:strand:+ start:8156 stop:9031 length:876 start_codon:yes stop_codon:yes gene_type:complete
MILSLPLVLALVVSGVFAGLLGALVGIGGGLIVVPVLVLGFGIDIKIAIASSLVAVVASSTASGSVYVGKGLTNLRLGMLLEVATTIGGITGGLIAVYISPTIISTLFSILMIVTCVLILRTKDPVKKTNLVGSGAGTMETAKEDVGKLSGSYFDPYLKTEIHYDVENVPLGSFISFFAGVLSGLLGVGGGFVKVPAMALAMKVPMKVAAATSNLMIGVTAISSLFVYFARGFVQPLIAAPVALGVVGGALYGTSLAQRISPKLLRKIFAAILVIVAVQMILKSMGVSVGK